MTRMPIVAGTFYEGSSNACRRAVKEMLDHADLPPELPEHCMGGLVPHAGWICSGTVAALTFKALARGWTGSTVILMGAVHTHTGPRGMLYSHGGWQSPLGEVSIDTDLAQALLEHCPDIEDDPGAHVTEHSLEVQLPFVQTLWPEAKIIPLMVPPSPLAPGIGEQVGQVLRSHRPDALVIGSTDLTHYGPRYGVTPAGVGKQGIAWAVENDRRLLELVQSMSAELILDETCQHLNACGGGAIAATIAACRALGASRATVLRHTNSYETLKAFYPTDTADTVGYASVVFS